MRKLSILMLCVLFVGAFLLVPVYAQNSNARVQVAPGLEKQLEQAAPGQMVTAIVKLREVGPAPQANLGRSSVLQRLRDNAQKAQTPLLRFLETPAVKANVNTVRPFWIDNLVLIEARKDVIEQIMRRPDIIEVFDNYTFTLGPRDPGPQQSHQSQPWDNIAYIGAKQVWQQYGINGTGVRVGGLDTGVDISHPDIAGKMFTNNPADPTYPGGWAEFDSNGLIKPGSVPHDSDQHGTHTSGTMIGGSASGWAIGVAPGAKLMHGLVIPGGSGSFGQVAAGMEWIIDPDDNPLTDDGADVVNMSLGATGTFTQMIAPTDNMVLAGVFPSFSIGNSGPGASTTGSPGNVPSAYGVGATDRFDAIASFSSRGPVTWNSPPYVGTWTKPDISAPGVAIFSAIPGNDWEGDWNGTSMAAPHVAGTAALMRQANPSLTVDQMKQLIAQTSLDLGAAGMDNTFGWGRINAFAAVTAALAGVGTIEGVVSSSGGGFVEAARVRLVETGQQVFTDASGHYTMKAVAGTYTVEVSRFGYATHSAANVNVVADQTTTLNVTLQQLPSGAIAGAVTDEETGAGISASISVRLGGQQVATASTNPGTGAYSVTLPVGVYDLVFNPVYPYPVTNRNGITVNEAATTTLNVELDPAEILVVDDDKGKGYETYYQNAIVAAGRSYITVSATPTAEQMAAFEAVVWLTGDDDLTTIAAADETALKAFLDGGGRLFISGQDIGYDIRTNTGNFYGNYLRAAYVQDDVALGAVDGSPISPVGTGLSFDIKGGTGANNQAFADEINPINGGAAAFLYDPTVPEAATTSNEVTKSGGITGQVITASGTAAVSYEGVYRLVYFAFGFEAIAQANDRTAVMDRVLDWLQGFPKIEHTPLGDTEDTANPYVVKALITSENFALAPATFAVVYSSNGGADMSVPMTATGNPNEYQGAIPAQPIDTEVEYYITASDVEEHTSTHPLGAPGIRHSFQVAKDMDPPVISHLRFRDTNDLTGPYMVRANVTDNVGVEAVYLLYSKNGGMYHRVEMLSDGDPPTEYTGGIPGPSVVGDQYDYYILAMDESYSGNVTREPASGAYHFTIVEEFVWDFEADDGGFTPAGSVWQWGTPTSGPGAAHSGVNLWATILGGTYPNNANATLDLPAIMIAADRPYAVFSLWHWFNMENNFDGGNVKVSTDGGATWTIVTPLRGYDGVGRTTNKGVPNEPIFTNIKEFWQEELFDLSAFAGEQAIIRLHFGTDGSVVRSGWYVDDMRLRSSNVDDVSPNISNVVVPKNSFNTSGPYAVSASVRDLFSGIANVTLYYNIDGGPYTPVSMTQGTGDVWNANIPGQPAGSRLRLYVTASDNAGNDTENPVGAPASTYAFSILPSADILVLDYSTSGATVDDYRVALEASGHEADYWDQPSQGALTDAQMQLYDMIILENRSSIATAEQTKLTAFLNSGTLGDKKRIMVLGFNVASLTTSRAWIEQYMRAAYVQSDPLYKQITGETNDPIGVGETFNIVGTSPDEVKRSDLFPGGVIVYRYTGVGGASNDINVLREEYEKEGIEWDGVMPHAPISLDATAGMRYNGPTYRSVYLTFNLDYITEPSRRAAILDRAINWTAAPEIVHTPLNDTEDQSSAYPVTALVYSADLDASRVRVTYDAGSGPVTGTMTPTGNPNEFSFGIPAQPWGTTVNYYLSAATNGGATSYHPESAPAEQHSFQVLSDNVPPEIVHAPHPNSANFAGPWTIRASVTDNVGVDPAGVSVVYNINGGANSTVAMAPVGGNEYEGNIPGPAVLGDVVNYFINARDVAAVPNIARDPASGSHSFEMVDFIAFDFEGSDGGFVKTGQDWEWGDPVANPSDAHSGLKAWATKLNGNYVASSNSKLDSPAFVVPTSQPYAQVSFWQWYDTELNYDGGNLKISTDGGASWTILTPDIGYNGLGRPTNAGVPNEPIFSGHGQKFWEKATFNLTAYRGQNVILRWHFGSDPSVLYSGWTVDDVLIEPVADDTAAPTFTARTIPFSTLDTVGPYVAKATVVDYLSGVGSCVLRYSTDDGATYTTVAMTPTAVPNEYSGNIPGQATGTRIKLYFEAADGAGNIAKDPAAPGNYQFGILPSGDYLVVLGGTAETDPLMYQEAFNTLGRTYDVWNWDDQGVPSQALLNAYDAVIVDESSYFDSAQQAALTTWLDTDDGTRQQVFFLGRDMQFGSSARTFMEKYTGTVYVKDNPAWFQIKSAPGDPIGNNETFTISGSFPDELKFSTLYPGAAAVYKYSGVGASADPTDMLDYRAFIEKEGKVWDEREMWPMAPNGPDSLAAVRYVGPKHAVVYFCFNLYYIQEPARRAAVLGRALDWLASTATVLASNQTSGTEIPKIPDQLTLGQNYPNPFNPSTQIRIGIPAKHSEPVSLRIYNVRGQLVKTVFEGIKPAGFHSFAWNGLDERGTSVASGVYFARFVSGQTHLTRKMVLLK